MRLWFFVFGSVAILAVLTVAACSSSSSPDSVSDSGPSDATTIDAGPDVDNGAPSTSYPAPHPALPQLVNAAKGPVLTNPKIELVYFPCDADAGAATCVPQETQLEAFAQKFASSSYWSAVTSEYGVGPITYAGSIALTGETPPKTIANTAVQTYMVGLLQSGKLGVPDPQTIYTLIYPQGTTITEANPLTVLLGAFSSCTNFLGYHDNVTATVGDAGSQTYPFAVIPSCAADLDSFTNPMSHEWVEASTDPDPVAMANGVFVASGGPNSAFFGVDSDHVAWTLLGGGEAGDLCEQGGPTINITPSDIGNSVQRTWSDKAATASHDPCVPDPSGAYFAAAPVLSDNVTFTTSFTGGVTSKGIVVPVGSSKTIEVDLFSDGDTGGPISVEAKDMLYTFYGADGIAETLQFAWDRPQGLNGEKLHLTISVTASSFLGGAHAFYIKAQIGNRYQLWPGLVVEK